MTLPVSAAWTLHPSPPPLHPPLTEWGRSRMTTFVNKKELGTPRLPVYAFHILATGTALSTPCTGGGIVRFQLLGLIKKLTILPLPFYICQTNNFANAMRN